MATVQFDGTSIEALFDCLFKYGGWVLFLILFVCAVFYAERFEKFIAMIFKFCSVCFKSIPWFKKKYIKHDFQSSVNNFSNGGARNERKRNDEAHRRYRSRRYSAKPGGRGGRGRGQRPLPGVGNPLSFHG